MLPASYYIVAAQRRLLRGIYKNNRNLEEILKPYVMTECCFDSDPIVVQSVSVESLIGDKRPKHKFRKRHKSDSDNYCTECWMFESKFKQTEGCDPVYCLGRESPWLAYLKLSPAQVLELKTSLTADLEKK